MKGRSKILDRLFAEYLVVDGMPSGDLPLHAVNHHGPVRAPLLVTCDLYLYASLLGDAGYSIGKLVDGIHLLVRAVGNHVPFYSPLRRTVVERLVKDWACVVSDKGEFLEAFFTAVNAVSNHVVFGSPLRGALGLYFCFAKIEFLGHCGRGQKLACDKGRNCQSQILVPVSDYDVEAKPVRKAPKKQAISAVQDVAVGGKGSSTVTPKLGQAYLQMASKYLPVGLGARRFFGGQAPSFSGGEL